MKYGWEIADEVQRFVSDSADMQFVSISEYNNLEQQIAKMEKRIEKLRNALKEIANTDFRGNRPNESVKAYNTLKEEEENK